MVNQRYSLVIILFTYLDYNDHNNCLNSPDKYENDYFFLSSIACTSNINISFIESFHRNTWTHQTDLLPTVWLHSSVGREWKPASQGPWVRSPLEPPDFAQVSVRDNCLKNISINTQVIIQNRALSLAASSRFATVSEDDFALKCFFFLFFWNNHLCIYTKTIIRLRLSDYRWIFTST